ncbi:MAG: FHA domain-containing protein, partial [Planctomycetes bacterium]|nr:FHA domain-containing protein [Planctomycetota bacterium]
MPKLHVRCEGEVHTVELEEGIVTVGRASENTIQIRDVKASRKHCQFEKTSDGWKLIDCESANGTEVNGAKVNHRLLAHDDRVTIGEVELRFDAPEAVLGAASTAIPLPEPAAPSAPLAARPARVETPLARMATPRPAGAALEQAGISVPASAPVPAPDAETRLGRRSLKPALATPQEAERRVFERMKVAAMICVAVGLLGFFGKRMMDEHRLVKSAAAAYDAACKTEKDGKFADALAAYKDYLGRYPQGANAADATTRTAKLNDRIALLDGAREAFSRLKIRLTSEIADLPGIRADLAALAAKIAGDPLAEKINFEISAVDLKIAKRGEAEFVALGERARKLMTEGEFGAALDQVKSFLATYATSKYAAKAQEQVDTILRAASDDYESLVASANKLLRERKFDTARRLLSERAYRYAGTRHQFEIQFKLYGIDMLARGSEERVLDAKLRELRRELMDLALKADDLAKQRKFEEARTAYQRIVARLDQEPQLADLRSLFERRQK